MPAEFLKSALRAADIPKSSKPQIAMVGRSNVGKSSLINHLAGKKNLAHSSTTPGLTRTINVYEFDGRYLLIDLPGYGFSRANRTGGKGFEGMIGDYLSEAAMLKLVLLIIDGRHGLTASDTDILGQLLTHEIPFVVVFNKIDKLSNSAATQALRRIQAKHPAAKFIPHSTVSGKGIGEIRDEIERAVRAA
ncbi:MAG: ribosome biogenesis GTP-binding protein YihA/YsxC [Patescibacteria group bacterium]